MCQHSFTPWTKALLSYGTSAQPANCGGTYQPIKQAHIEFLQELAALATPVHNEIGELLMNGKDIRVFSDPHFAHANIINLCGRPFSDVSAMDKELLQNIEQGCEEADLMLFLGDWSMKNPLHIAQQMYQKWGSKMRSVLGNHDMKNSSPGQWARINTFSALEFSVTRDWLQNELDIPDFSWGSLPKVIKVGVSHWPVAPDYFPQSNYVCLHGHSHDKSRGALRWNACVENTSYKPKHLRDFFTAPALQELAQRQVEGLPEKVPSKNLDY